MEKVIHINKVRISLLEEGIIENFFLGGKAIEPADMWEAKAINLKFSKDKPYTVLVLAEELTSFSIETRELVASKDFQGKNIAKALVFDGLGQRIIANFYMRVNRPHIKTAVFGDRQRAILWLQDELAKYYKSGNPL